jgi:SAM-dependent methyltransferase
VRQPDEIKQATRSVWGASPAGWTFGEGAEPGSREFFEAVLERRSTYEQPWLPDVIPFASFAGKQVLEIGCGAGYDAYELTRNGADYTGIDITPENPERVRKHLAYYGFEPNVIEADAEALPFDDASFDVVYSNGVLHCTPDMPRAFREALRVLRPGGEFYLSVYNRDSIVYWLNLGLTEQFLKGGFRKQSLKTRLAMVEHTTSDQLPLVNVYSARQLRSILRDAGFAPASTKIRKLVAEDLPWLPGLTRVWRRIPQRWLDQVGRKWGWYVWAHARKPH